MTRFLKFTILYLIITVAFSQTLFAHRYDRDYPIVSSAYWDSFIARWEVDGYADKFEVILYRNNHIVTTITTYSRSYSFSGYIIERVCDYYFEVRPYSRYFGWGRWVSSNRLTLGNPSYNYDPYYYRESNEPPIYNQPYNINSGNSNSVDTGIRNVIVPEPQIVYDNGIIPLGIFVEANNETYYSYLNGVYARNIWLNTKGKWYYLDTSGKMIRGLYRMNNATYYFNDDGSMATGNTVINGVNHYFDAVGIMVY